MLNSHTGLVVTTLENVVTIYLYHHRKAYWTWLEQQQGRGTTSHGAGRKGPSNETWRQQLEYNRVLELPTAVGLSDPDVTPKALIKPVLKSFLLSQIYWLLSNAIIYCPILATEKLLLKRYLNTLD